MLGVKIRCNDLRGSEGRERLARRRGGAEERRGAECSAKRGVTQRAPSFRRDSERERLLWEGVTAAPPKGTSAVPGWGHSGESE